MEQNQDVMKSLIFVLKWGSYIETEQIDLQKVYPK